MRSVNQKELNMQRTRSFRDSDRHQSETTGYAGEEKAPAPITAQPDASEAQVKFINSLMGEVELTDEQRSGAETALEGGLTKSQASSWISRLLELKKTQPKMRSVTTASREPLPDVPAGRYAITGQDDSTDFYKVDRPEEGKWAGYTFVKLLVASGGFGDDLSEQRVSFAQIRSVLERILEDGPEKAMKRYGHELGECGHCGRTLTNPESIELGIGPVCAGKMGF